MPTPPIQVTAQGKVRSDADFVFFNQPASPEGAVRLTPPDGLQIELSKVPAEINRITVAVAFDDSVPGGLGDVQLGAMVLGGGEPIAVRAEGLAGERAAVLLELYRRAAGWKVRVVSAGWAAGFAALVREHGVDVDEPETAAAPTAAAPAPAPVAPAPAAAPVAPPAPAPGPPAPTARSTSVSAPAPSIWRRANGFRSRRPSRSPRRSTGRRPPTTTSTRSCSTPTGTSRR